MSPFNCLSLNIKPNYTSKKWVQVRLGALKCIRAIFCVWIFLDTKLIHLQHFSVAVILGISETAVDKNLKFLKENGFIERKDSKKAGYWVVL